MRECYLPQLPVLFNGINEELHAGRGGPPLLVIRVAPWFITLRLCIIIIIPNQVMAFNELAFNMRWFRQV